MPVRQPSPFERRELDTRRQRVTLGSLCLLMLAVGLAFAVIAGPPRLPDRLPSLDDIVATLAGSTLPVDAVVLLLVDVAWLLWIWIVGSLCLELALVAAEVFARGAGWVRQLRSVADRLSVPLVRRAVAAAFAVQVISRGVPIASAQTIAPPQALVTAVRPAGDLVADVPPPSAPLYLVREGDTLWSIAERAYGSGEAYPRLIEANLGRRMADGQVFSQRGVIQPGWQLALPGAATPVEAEGGDRWYTVQPGDTLSSIAATTLGDQSSWGELFAANEGSATPDGLHTLIDADVIWPGLRLKLPDDEPVIDPPTEPAAEPEQVDLIAASAAPAPTVVPAPMVDVPLAPAPPDVPAPADAPLPPAVPEPRDAPIAADLPPLVRTQHDSPPLPDPAPVAAGDADASVPNTSLSRELTTVLPYALGGLGAAALGSLIFGMRRRRRLRPLPGQPESDIVVQGGFAEAELAHELTRGMHGVGFDPVAALVGQFEQFLAEYNLTEVRVLTVSHGRSSTTIKVQCQLAEQVILVDLAPEFAQRLGAEVEPTVSVDQDVVLRLTGLRRTRLLPFAEVSQRGPCLVPLGVLLDKQAFLAEWSSLGHVLVVSLPGHGADTILTSLVAALTARRSPEQLRVWVIGSRRALPAPLFDVPHLAEVIDPADETALTTAIAALRTELEQRANQAVMRDLVVVVPELAALGEQADTLALLMSQSAELGVRFVVASTRPDDALASSMRPHFGTRMVLRMQSDDASVALLGVSDAASLPGGGRICLRIDGREVIELYGYQISPEHLDRLVALMRSAYSSPSTLPGPTDAPPGLGDDVVPARERAQTEPESTLADPSPPPSSPVVESESTDLQASTPPESDVLGVNAPPIEVFCLGDVRVLCLGQQVWPRARGGDAKPWELLLYGACQPSEGVTRRAVETALWPDDEQPEQRPHRFRQLRYRLRQRLEAVAGKAMEDGICLDQISLRLDPAMVYSDAQEFLALVRTARGREPHEAIPRLERARGLYAGDLMDGPDARRYTWIEERDDSGVTLREHFRHLFQQASQNLAEAYASIGALDESIRVYRDLTEIDPTDEERWRVLFRLHALRGDRAELMREENRMRLCLHELAEDADLTTGQPIDEPSRETVEEFARLLASLRDREPATV